MSAPSISTVCQQLAGYNQHVSSISPDHVYDTLDSAIFSLKVMKETRAIALKIIGGEIPATGETVRASFLLKANSEIIIRRIRTLYAPPLTEELSALFSLLDESPSEETLNEMIRLCEIGVFFVEGNVRVGGVSEFVSLTFLISQVNSCILKAKSLGFDTNSRGCSLITWTF